MSSTKTLYPNHAGTGRVKVVYAWTEGYTDEITVYCRDTATVTPTINTSSLTYNGTNKTLVTATTSSHVSTFYIGYKKGSQATADSQITWMSANATTITAKDAGTYYIYYKATGATDYCNIPYTLKGSKAIACASAYATAGNISTYVTYSTSSQTITLPIASNSGTVTFPSSVSATNTNTNTSYTWSCNSSGTVTIPANQGSGSYTITATVSIAASSNGNYCSGSKSLTWYSAINCQTYDANIYGAVGSVTFQAGSSVPYGQQIHHAFICGIPGTLFWDTEENWVQNGYVGNTVTYSGSDVGQIVYFAPMTVTATAGTNKTTIRACFVPNDTTRYCIAGGDYMYAGLDFWVTVSKADNPVTLSPTSTSSNRIKLYANHDNCTINTKTITVNNLQGTVTSVTSSNTNVVSIGSYSSSSIKLDYVGNGTATITVSITGNTNYLGATKYIYVECKTDTEYSTEYKNEACTQTGHNVTTYGTPSVSIGSGLTAAGGSATVTCTVTNTSQWYQKWESGCVKSHTGNKTGTARWRITSNGNNRFSHPSSGGSTLNVGGTNVTVYDTGTSVSHSSMTTNVVTDSVTVTAYNIGDTSKSATASKSVSNSLGTDKYKNTSGTTGYNVVYTTPSVSIGSGMTAAGGSATVTCTVTNNTNWYQKYTSGSYTGQQTGTEAGTARWRITSNGNSAFSEPSSGGSTLNVGGSNVTVYNTGTSVSHSNMTTNARTDSVTVTAYNIGDTTKSATASKSITNSKDNTNYSPSNYTASVSIGSGLTAGGGSATVTASASHLAYDYYTSGSYNNQHTVSDSVSWVITTQTFTPSGGSASTITRFSKSGNTLSHSSMTSNVGTDYVKVTATNGSSSSATATADKSITNTLPSTKYKNTSGTTGYNVVYTTPSVSIGSGMTAAGGSATVSCSVTNNTNWYQKYDSGTYTSQYTGTEAGTATWNITTQTFTPSGGSATTITRFSKSGNTLSHSSMTSNVGTDYVKVTATNSGDSSKTATADKSITNTLPSTKYKNTSGTTGYNVEYVTPQTCTIGSGMTAAGGSATVTCTVTNNTNWYQKYDSGTYTSQYTGTEAGTARWRITSNGNSAFSEPSSGGSTLNVGGSNVTVYNTGTSVSHSNMTTNARTDSVTVTAYNIGDTTKTKTATASVTNSLGTQKYKNTSGTTGYNITYVAPTVSIGSGLTAAGGSATVTCTVTNNTNWYQKYDSGSYTGQQTGTEAGTATWAITSQTYTSQIASAVNTTRFSKSGNTLSHTTMGTNVGKDYVVITATNSGDSSKTATANTTVKNKVTSITPKKDDYTDGAHFYYPNIGAGATSASPVGCGGAVYRLGSGSDIQDNSTSPSFGGTAQYIRSNYTLSTVQNGFTAVNSSTGVLTATNRGTTTGNAWSSGGVSAKLIIKYTHTSVLDETVVTSSEKTSTGVTCQQAANTLTWNNPTVSHTTPISLAVAGQTYTMSPSITQSGTYSSGSSASNTTATYSYTVQTTKDGYSLSSNKVTVTNNTSTSARNGFVVRITATANSKSGTKDVTFNQAAGAKSYGTPSVTAYTYATFAAGGATKTPNSVTYTQTWTWNGVSGSGGTITSGGTLAYNTTGTLPSGFSTGSDFATTGSCTWANRGTTTGDARSAKSNLQVTVTLNGVSSSKYTCTACDQQANSIITTQKYKNTSGTTGYNITYVVPQTVTVTNNLTASGGSFKVNCSVTNNTDWYYKYTSGSYTTQQTGTEAGTARWRITSNGNNRFSHPSSGGSTLNVGGTNVTVYNTGTSGSHQSMTTNVTTDKVIVTAYNIGDPTKTKEGSASISNAITSLNLTVGTNPIVYNASTAPTTSATVTATYTSGSTLDVTSGSTFTTNPTGIVQIS